MIDFFISYTSADEAWAEWIAWVLEAAGFSVTVQKWDFRPGSNFVLEVQLSSSRKASSLI
jgi:TIR domain